jgi:hypothetical protein
MTRIISLRPYAGPVTTVPPTPIGPLARNVMMAVVSIKYAVQF